MESFVGVSRVNKADCVTKLPVVRFEVQVILRNHLDLDKESKSFRSYEVNVVREMYLLPRNVSSLIPFFDWKGMAWLGTLLQTLSMFSTSLYKAPEMGGPIVVDFLESTPCSLAVSLDRNTGTFPTINSLLQ